jgi:BED zinc finger
MRKSKVHLKDEYKDTSELEYETMDDRTEDEDEYRTADEKEDELVTEDEDETVTENEDELVTEDELMTEDENEHVAGEPVAEDEEELRDKDENEHVAGEPVAEDEEELRDEDEEEPRNDGEDRTRPKVPIQHGKRGTRSIKSRSQNKGGASKSAVWNHFNIKTAKYPGRPVCRKCNALFSAGSGTSTLRRHLSSHKIAAPKQHQRTMHDYRTDPYPKNEQEERDKLVGVWVVCDNQPFSVVECEEWRRMITKFDPRYRFHNRHTLKNNIVDLFKEKLEIVKLAVQQIPGKVALTSDMWTASNSSSFLSLTIHYVDSSWKLKNFLLDIIPIEVRHSGYNMANAIIEVLRQFGLAEKTLALTTDNASSMISCGEFILEELEEEFQNLDFAHYRCAAHVLNLAVNKGLSVISESVRKVRSLMSYIKNSQPVRDSLKSLCKVKGINYLAPELDVNTRWNSTFYMLEKWKRMEPALNLLAADDLSVRRRYLNDVDRVNIDVSGF